MHSRTVDIILHCIEVSRLQEMFRFQGVDIYMYLSLQFDVLHSSCAEDLHFSALVYNSFANYELK